jgi:hypothetical protein
MTGPGDLTERSLEELVQHTGQPESQMALWTQLEFLRRQTLIQREAADATKEAAEHAKRNANYMLWSVIVLTLASIAQVLVAWLK